MTPPPDRSPSLFGETVAALAGAVVPGLTPSVKRMVVAAETELARTRSVALAAAAVQADMTREELQDAIAADPRVVPLLQRLLYAAGMTGYDPLLTALGVAFGRAVRDPEVRDESAMLLEALEGMTAAHVDVLLLLTSAPGGGARDWRAAAADAHTWRLPQLQDRAGQPPHVVSLVLRGLVARHLIAAQIGARSASSTFTISELGSTVLELLQVHRDGDGH